MRVGLFKTAWVVAGALMAFVLAGETPAGAASFRITLDDGAEVVGVVESFEDGVYRVTTPKGAMNINADIVRGMEVLDGGQSAPPDSPGGAANGASKEIPPEARFTILTGDSQMVVGRLLSFEDGVYRVDTKSGEVAVPVDKVEKIEIAWLQTPDAAPGAPPPASGASALAPGTLRLAGSSAMSEGLAPALLEAFVEDGAGKDLRWSRGTAASLRILTAATSKPGKFVTEMRVRDSAHAVEALARGETDIAMMSRQMTSEEAQTVTAANLGNPLSPEQEHVVAPGGVVVLVHPSNPVKALRVDQISDIFSGKIRNWSEVGGAPRRIQVHLPSEGSGIRAVLQKRVLGTTPFLPTAKANPSNVELAETIAADPAAIGVVEFAHVGNAAALSIIDECRTVHAPSPFSILTEDYPLSTRLYFYTAAQPSPTARAFLKYALSEAGQRKLAERGLVSFLPSADPKGAPRPPALTAGGERSPAEQRVAGDLAKLAAAASRVSVVFQFGFAAAVLDSRGEDDIGRLAAFLKEKKGSQRVALVGFSDGTGPLENNVKLSERRAKLIAQKLAEQGVKADLVAGFGALLPIACGTTPEAAAKNRRVEAWLY